jgi:hypothetical protein
MAYSRFSKQSNWYCFWSSMGNEDTMYKLPTRRLKRKQVFQICDIPSYYVTYGEIMDKGIPAIIDDIRHYYYYSHGEYRAKRPTEKDMMQMYDYIKIFVDDIDYHFKLHNFFMYEWYYPIRNKIRRRWKRLIKK